MVNQLQFKYIAIVLGSFAFFGVNAARTKFTVPDHLVSNVTKYTSSTVTHEEAFRRYQEKFARFLLKDIKSDMYLAWKCYQASNNVAHYVAWLQNGIYQVIEVKEENKDNPIIKRVCAEYIELLQGVIEQVL